MIPVFAPRTIGRYRLERVLGEGGMGRVYRGRLHGDGGFSRAVAIKCLRPELASNAACVSMLLDEARILSFVRSPFVVETLDLVHHGGEFFVAMEYVEGAPLDRLMRAGGEIPVDVAATIATQVLHGLHAAHTAKDDRGSALHIVHRDVSPSNVIVGVDGVAKLLDFGIAKARERIERTKSGVVKGKPSYMAPEQLFGCAVDARADVFALGVVLWEMLSGTRLFVNEILFGGVSGGRKLACIAEAPSAVSDRPDVAVLDAIVLRALAMEPEDRFESALAMAEAIEQAIRPDPRLVAEWLALHPHTVASSEEATHTERVAYDATWAANTEALAPSATLIEAQPNLVDFVEEPGQPTPTVRTVGRRRILAGWAVASAFCAVAAMAAHAASTGPGAIATNVQPTAPREAPSQEVPTSGSVAPVVLVVEDRPVASATATVLELGPDVNAASDGSTARQAAPPMVHAKSTSAVPHSAPARPAASVRTATVDCQSPFRIEADGTKIPKRECFREH